MQRSTISIRSLAILFLTIMPHASWAAAFNTPKIKEADFRAYVGDMETQIKALNATATAMKYAGGALSVMSSFLNAVPSKKPSASPKQQAPATPSTPPSTPKKKEGWVAELESQREKAAYLDRYFGNKASINRAIGDVATNPPTFIAEVFNEYLGLPAREQTSEKLADILHRKNVQNFGLPDGTTYQQLYEAVTAKRPDQTYVIPDAQYFQNTTAALLVLFVKKAMN